MKPALKLSLKPPGAVLLLAIIVSGCGQRGPLYLPGQPPQKNAPATPAKPAPTDSSSTNSK